MTDYGFISRPQMVYTINSTLCENQIATHLKQFGQPEPFPPHHKTSQQSTTRISPKILTSYQIPSFTWFLAHGQCLPIGGAWRHAPPEI